MKVQESDYYTVYAACICRPDAGTLVPSCYALTVLAIRTVCNLATT